jgi:minor extracellular serine protease Vpr
MTVKWILVFGLPLLAAGADSHRYLVELSGPSVAEHIANESKRTGKHVALDSEVAKTRRQQLRDEQKQAQTALEGLGVKVLDHTETVSNTLIVDMPDNLVDQVAALPGVKRVQKARPVKMHIDHALPIHNVPQAWAATGGMANAGLGIKIGMIDTGIDITHPGMQDSTLQVPAGFPKVNADSDTAYTNSKVIVARSYAALFNAVEDTLSAEDVVGHGTGTAMAAAGVQNTGPFGTIVGVAPKAWLGAYKVIGANGGGDQSVIVKALDDAVADGMDVLNLSLGLQGAEALRLADDVEAQEIQRIVGLGIIVVDSSGNGSNAAFLDDPNTISSPATAPSTISVGASFNNRIFFPASVMAPGGALYGAFTDNGPDQTNPPPSGPVSGQVFDVSTLDTIGDACLPFPRGSMTGMIALIIRGTCTFESKMDDVQGAGAVAALIYTPPNNDLPTLSGGAFSAGAATLPAVIIDNLDGVAIKQQLAANPSLTVTLNFTITSVSNPADIALFRSPASPNGVPGFSVGPSVDGSIKPDLVAVGTDIYTATETTAPNGELYDPSGYVPGVAGTSYSAPLVSGAAAVLKAFRPGLTVDQYRSLLINTAGTIPGRVMEIGAGLLNAQAAVTATFAANPTALSFNIGDGNPNISQTLTISNVGASAESYTLAVAPRDAGVPAPALGSSTLSVQPGQSASVPVTFVGSGLAGGQYEGYVTIQGSQSGVQERVPYWYGVPTNVPANITPVFVTGFDDGAQYNAGARITDAIEFRVTDSSGIIIANPQATVTALPGDPTIPTVTGTVTGTISIDNQFPGVMRVSVRLSTSPGANIFQIAVGNLTPFEIEIDGN